MRQAFILISLLWIGYAEAQTSVLHARFKSLQNGEGVMYARVTTSTGQTKLTNVYGDVQISYPTGTSITITHLNYDSLIIRPAPFAGRDSLLFYLQPKVYVLPEVSFSILGERSLFNHKFIEHDLGKSDEEKIREKLNIIDMKMELISLDKAAQDGRVLGSPISYLYDRFSKAGKERTKYNLLVERDRRRKNVYQKFDDLIINTLTNYEDEELAKFKEFCAFHPTYVEAVDALELYYEILRCRKEYIQKDI